MKIIRLTTFLDYGGIERKMVNTSAWKDENDWLYLALGKGGEAEKSIESNGKKVKCLNISYKIPSIGTIATLYKIFKTEKPDIVHTAGAEANFHGVIAAKLANVPVKIAEEIGIPNHNRLAKLLFSLVFNIADYVVGESNIVVQFLKHNYRLPEWKVKKIFNFIIAPDITNASKIEDGNFKIVSISRLVKVKNIEAVIKVLPELLKKFPNLLYTIVGSGSEEENLKGLVSDLGVDRAVSFAGFTSTPFKFLQESDLFILNSLSEGFSNSLLEAMYCGTPCLSTRVGGAEDMIEDDFNGWLITPGSETELLSKLRYILALDSNTRKRVGFRGRDTVQKSFTLQNHVKDLLKLYQEGLVNKSMPIV